MEIENQARKIKIIQNFSILSAGRIVSEALTFTLFIFLSRIFGQEGLGIYSFAIAFSGFFAVAADFGLYGFSIKELNQKKDDFSRCFSCYLSLRIILSATIYLILIATIPILPFSRETKIVISIIGANQIVNTLLEGNAGIFIAHQEGRYASLFTVSNRFIAILSCSLIMFLGGDLTIVFLPMPIITAFHFFISLILVTKKYGRIKLFSSLSNIKSKMHEAFPYALSSYLFQFNSRTDSVLIGFFISSVAVGAYNAANYILTFLTFIPYNMSLAIFPLSSRLFLESKKELKKLYNNSIGIAVLTGLPAAAGLVLISDDIITILYGNDFKESILILQILGWLLFLRFLSRTIGNFVTSCNLQVVRTKSQVIMATINVVGNLILIPSIGIKGAAFATLLSEFILIGLYIRTLHHILGWPIIGKKLLEACIATSSFYIIFSNLPHMDIYIVIPGSIIIYLSVLALFKNIRDNEFKTVLSLLQKRKNKLSVKKTDAGETLKRESRSTINGLGIQSSKHQ